jgi:Tfp pilus assembly protein PilO
MRADRLWLIGGCLGMALLVALGWLFLVSPRYAEAADLRVQTEAVDQSFSTLQRRLADLRRQNEDLATYRDRLARDRAALPTEDAAADLLREMQAAGEAAGVSVTGVTAGAAADVTVAGTAVKVLPVSLTASGPGDRFNAFLDQLQQVQPRALLISSVNVAPASDPDGAAAGRAMLSLTLEAFYAPAAG